MRNRTTLIFLLILFVGSLFMNNDALAAWTQAKGHSYNQLTFSYYTTSELYSTVEHENTDVIEKVGSAKFRSRDVSYYGEYGITDTVTVFTSFAWKMPESDDTEQYADENGPSGFGDIDLGLRYNLSPNLFGTGILMSVQGTVKIPEAYDYGFPLTYLSQGDGQYDTTLELLFGRGLGKGYMLFNVGYKYRWENNEIDLWPDDGSVDRGLDYDFKPSDQIKVFIGGGYGIAPKLELRLSLDYTKSIGNAEVSQNLVEAAYPYGVSALEMHKLVKDTLSLEQEVLNMGVGLAYSTSPKTQIVFTYNEDIRGWDIIRTKNAGKGHTYNLAFVYMH
jgi:hypothetical protein